MQILLVSPFHGRSSHAAWAEGYQRWSRHRFLKLTMPDRSWARRMKEAAWPLAHRAALLEEPVDLLMATSMLDLASFLAFVRRSPLGRVPAVMYMHENQLTYPIRPEGRRDRHAVGIALQSALAADILWFNSQHNLDSTVRAVRKMDWSADESLSPECSRSAQLRRKGRVMPVGLELPEMASYRPRTAARPLLVWNQRWEWDKAPERFCRLVADLQKEVDFDVVLLGGEPQREPPERTVLIRMLGPRLLHNGWCDRETYWGWLQRADLTVSVARHEFFGISILEAVAAGVHPLLPRRLSYPEVLPREFHPHCLYDRYDELLGKAVCILRRQAPPVDRQSLAQSPRRYCWSRLAEEYDTALDAVVRK